MTSLPFDDPNGTPVQKEKTVQVFQGTCGWSQQQFAQWDLGGKGRRPSAADVKKHPLRLYASQWPAVEVNSSNYAIPTVSAVEGWCAQVNTRGKHGFRFTFKAFSLFTHRHVDPKALPARVRGLLSGSQREARRVEWSEMGPGTLDSVWEAFNEVLIAAYRNTEHGVVGVFQFPLGFGPTAANLRHVLECRRRLDYRIGMAVEFRERAWFVGEAKTQLNLIQKLRDRGIALVHADELLHETFPKECMDKPVHKVLPVSMDVTSAEFAYVRIHRRTGFEDRRLSREEIDRWARRIATIASQLDDGGIIFVFWGTEHRNEPLINGMNLAEALEAVPGVVVAEPSNPLRQGKALSIDDYFPFMGK